MEKEISLLPKDDGLLLFFTFAVVFFVLGLEYMYARRKGLKIFRFQNTIANISMGIFDRIAGIFLVPLIYFWFDFLHQNVGLFNIPETMGWFAIAVLCSDFTWYFYHKAGHRVNLFWGAHIIHHQSEDYNYSVAFNLTPFQVFVRVMFWSIMPMIGFSAKTILGTHLVIGLYQFLLHTPLIPKLGVIEKFLVTPSHHRVHHGSNPEYLDKNYGGVLIIWDRMFGTFQEEVNEVSYGITKDINSRGFLTNVFHYYQNLIYLTRQVPSFSDKLKIVFKGPDWVPASGELEHLPLYIDKGAYDYKEYTTGQKIFIVANIVSLMVIMASMSYMITKIPYIGIEIITMFIMITLVSIGRLLELKPIIKLEIFKYTVALAYILYLFLI